MALRTIYSVLADGADLDLDDDLFVADVDTASPSAPVPPSDVFTLYQSLYYNANMTKVRKANSQIAIPYTVLKQKLAERLFDLSKLEAMWNAAFLAVVAWDQKAPQPFIPLLEEVKGHHEDSIPYTYDSLVWSLGLLIRVSPRDGTILNLKFSNDGFLYKKHNEMDIWKINGVPRDNLTMHQKTTGWCVLDLPKYTQFDVFKTYAKKWLNQPKLKFQVTYNYNLGRIDFKAFDNKNNRSVTISFEPGFPESDLEDCWIEE